MLAVPLTGMVRSLGRSRGKQKLVNSKGRMREVKTPCLKRSTNTHANRHPICPIADEADRSGCGACRLAAVYRTIASVMR